MTTNLPHPSRWTSSTSLKLPGSRAVNVSGGVNAKYLIEATGNGVVIFDYDNDGLMDVFLASFLK